MSAAVLLPVEASPSPPLQRARGRARISFRRDGAVNRLFEFHQDGCCKIRLPRVEPGLPPEAVLLNTAGGITGGDRLIYEVALGDGAEALVTTQAAERIYRRSSGFGQIDNRLSLGAGAHLDWLPQETILFDHSALTRCLEVDLGPGASALLVETMVFGRSAMGEAIHAVTLRDRWRVRREGRLVFADGIVIDGDASAILASGATGGDAVAVATLVLVAEDAPAWLPAIRELLSTLASEAGASTWSGLVSVRLVAPTSQILRQDLMILIEAVRGGPMPRVWHC